MNTKTIKICALILILGLPLVLLFFPIMPSQIGLLHVREWIFGASIVIFFWMTCVFTGHRWPCIPALFVAFAAASSYIGICDQLLFRPTDFVQTIFFDGCAGVLTLYLLALATSGCS